jgi:hypothetical protein
MVAPTAEALSRGVSFCRPIGATGTCLFFTLSPRARRSARPTVDLAADQLLALESIQNRGVLMGVGAFPDGGRDGPNPKLLCGDRLATDGIRPPSRQHPVQHRHADGRLGLLSRKAAGA